MIDETSFDNYCDQEYPWLRSQFAKNDRGGPSTKFDPSSRKLATLTGLKPRDKAGHNAVVMMNITPHHDTYYHDFVRAPGDNLRTTKNIRIQLQGDLTVSMVLATLGNTIMKKYRERQKTDWIETNYTAPALAVLGLRLRDTLSAGCDTADGLIFIVVRIFGLKWADRVAMMVTHILALYLTRRLPVASLHDRPGLHPRA